MIIEEMPMQVYREWRAVSASDLKNFRRSPAYAKLNPPIDGDSLEWGTAVHCAVLEPHALETRYGIDPEKPGVGGYPAGWRNTKEYKEQRAALLAQPGIVGLLTREQVGQLQQIVGNVATNDVGKLLHELPGTRETSLFVDDPEFGVQRKIRPDWLIPKAAMSVDVKTARDWRPSAFSRACVQHGYHLTAAFYLDTLAMLDHVLVDHYVFLVIASDAPFEVAAYTLDHDSVEQGRAEYRKALAGWSRCVETGIWPGGADKIQELRIPEYAIDYYQEG